MRYPTPAWKLEGFLERFDAWAEREVLTPDQRVFVIHWIMSRSEDPYQGVRREPGFPNLWWGVVPNSSDGKGNVVVCSYWIQETTRTVRCDNFGLLRWPV
jgi:hypothetical protein